MTTTAAENLVGITTRRVVFSYKGQTMAKPAGTEVHAHIRRDGLITIRVPGTLYDMEVYASAVTAP